MYERHPVMHRRRLARPPWVIALALFGSAGCTGRITDNGATLPASGAQQNGDMPTPPTGGTPSPSATGGGSSGSTTTGGSGGSGGTNSGGTATAPPVGTDGRYACDGDTHGTVAPLRRLTQAEFQNVIEDVFGISVGTTFPSSYGKSATGFSTEIAINNMSEQGVQQVMQAAEEVAEGLPAVLAKVLPCSKSGANDSCATTYLDTVGRRLFRRALTSDEETELLGVYQNEMDDGAAFADAVSVMTAQMLQMPSFIYMLEDPSNTNKDRPRTGLELATRLAFQLWDSAPDDTLLARAENGELDTREAVMEEAQRMFADPKSDREFVRFFREWADTPLLTTNSKDHSAFPYYDAQFIASMNESFDRFAVDEMRSSQSLYDVFRSNNAWVDTNMASFMGLPSVSTWTKVTLPDDRYSGIMTQPAVLAALAHTVDSSFVFRGREILKRFMCIDVGAPPPDAMAQFGRLTIPEDPTGKDVASAIESQSACRGCHSMLNPPGLAFEHFDGMGAYRDAYDSGKAIDTSGTLDGVGDTPIAFDGPADLMEAIAQQDQTQRCFATQLVRFTASRMDDTGDVCAIQDVEDALKAADGKIDAAFLATTQTDSFMYRRGD